MGCTVRMCVSALTSLHLMANGCIVHVSVGKNNSLPDLEKSWKTPAPTFFYLRLAYVCAYSRWFHVDGQFLSRRSHLLLVL